MKTWALAVAVLVVAALAIVEARTYSADRFDSRIEVLRGGSIRVVETVVLRFDSGTFTQFYRVIPTRRTDGIEIESASLNGNVLPSGEGPGQVKISGGNRIRVTWHFPPTTNASHTFQLAYRVRGVVRQENDADVLAWRALPTEHQYAIRGSVVDLFLPVAPLTTPSAVVHRAGDSIVTPEGTHTRIALTDIRSNGWIEPWARMPRGSVIDVPPAWQQQAAAIRAQSRRWIVAAGVVLVLGLAVLFAIRQGYDTPPGEVVSTAGGLNPPDPLPAALAGPLVANGAVRLEHAMAALFTMADRGELAIEERPPSFGQRKFAIARAAASRAVEPFEHAVLDIVFSEAPEPSVALSKARSRLMRQFKKFRDPVTDAMRHLRLLDEGRSEVRKRFQSAAIAAFVLAALAALPAALGADRFGLWPMLIAAAFALIGAAALIFWAAHTPLSNEGLRRAEHWRAFRRYLRAVARDREPSPPGTNARRLLPYAVALGVAPAWSAYLKRHRAAAPPWFHATAANDASAFAALVAMGGAGSSGGAHGVAGGGAAGGGASGAS